MYMYMYVPVTEYQEMEEKNGEVDNHWPCNETSSPRQKMILKLRLRGIGGGGRKNHVTSHDNHNTQTMRQAALARKWFLN